MRDPLTILQGDWVEQLRTLPDCSVQCCVTSPPYWGLRSYLPKSSPLKPLELGQERTPEEYVTKLVCAFREVRRVLKNDGVLWLNLGDCYASKGGKAAGGNRAAMGMEGMQQIPPGSNLKPKDLVGVPWMVALALRADGWWLRQDVIWSKPNPMPESVTDRCTRAHEYLFMLTKSSRYLYDKEAIKEQPSPALVKKVEEGYNGHALKDYLTSNVQDASATKSRIIQDHRNRIDKQRGHGRRHAGFNGKWDALTPSEQALLGSNKRSVWTVPPANFKDTHFATFPEALILPCILACSRPDDAVLDPFGGSGTVGKVALERGRRAILIELNPDYCAMADRLTRVTGLPL